MTTWKNEREFVRFLQLHFNNSGVVGIGDDTAVLPAARGHLLFTTDMMIEGVHFTRRTCAPEWLAHKLLARSVSDVAAMGGIPGSFVVSLGVPSKIPRDFLPRFYRGLRRAQKNFGARLVGGDLSRSPGGLFTSLAMLGSSSRPPVLRKGARRGDSIWVTGRLGRSAAALQALRSRRAALDVAHAGFHLSSSGGAGKRSLRKLMEAHFLPRPPWKIAPWLSTLASAMIDISDGLSLDLHRLCEASGVGAVIWAEDIPIAPEVAHWSTDPLECALHGGEDYELLLTVPEKAERKLRLRSGVSLHRIGRIVPLRAGVMLETNGKFEPVPPLGFDHFGTGARLRR